MAVVAVAVAVAHSPQLSNKSWIGMTQGQVILALVFYSRPSASISKCWTYLTLGSHDPAKSYLRVSGSSVDQIAASSYC